MQNKIGDIVLIPFPFSDLSDSKVRPAVILQFDQDDIIVVFITTKDVENSIKIVDIAGTNLTTISYIRYTKIASLNKKIIIGTLGKLGKTDLQTLKTKLKKFLEL